MTRELIKFLEVSCTKLRGSKEDIMNGALDEDCKNVIKHYVFEVHCTSLPDNISYITNADFIQIRDFSKTAPVDEMEEACKSAVLLLENHVIHGMKFTY